MQYVFSCCVPESSSHILTSDIQQTYRSNHEPSGRLKGCKKSTENSNTVIQKSGGGCLREVPTLVTKLRNFWCFGWVVAYRRCLLTRGGHTWRFDCIAPILSSYNAPKRLTRVFSVSNRVFFLFVGFRFSGDILFK